jgi:hypothetical protein
MADYCVYWIRRAHDHLPECSKTDPLAGRAGLVGTQNIRNNQSRVGGLDHVVTTGTIIEAVDNQPWSGDANVHVSIANWVKTADPALSPKCRRLWSKVVRPSKRIKGKRADKEYELKVTECAAINASLSDDADLSGAKTIEANAEPKRTFQGITPGHAGFLLTPDERQALISKDPKSAEVIFPYLIGRELLTGDGTPERFLIDFERRTMPEAQAYKLAFKQVQDVVLPARQQAAAEGKDAAGNIRPHHRQFLERWWKLAWDREDMVEAIRRIGNRFMVCSRVTKRPVFIFVDAAIKPGDALQTFIFNDDYSFGMLQSDLHWQWFVANCSKLKSDYRYTPPTVFDTFPWPQSPTAKQIESVAAAAVEVRRVRGEALALTTGGLRAVYRTLELPGRHPLKDAHQQLDAAVLAAYGFDAKKDLLAQLLELNLSVAALEKQGKPVTAPGIPAGYAHPERLITSDCIQP